MTRMRSMLPLSARSVNAISIHGYKACDRAGFFARTFSAQILVQRSASVGLGHGVTAFLGQTAGAMQREESAA